LINTGMDLQREDLQRLRRGSAVVVRKQADAAAALGAALQGFFSLLDEPSVPLAELGGRRVLLVDDDVRNIYAMSALLDELGLHVVTAADGLEALERFEREPVDLILLDMAMPRMDGYTAAGILRGERGCRVPLIALTAHAMKGDREKCIAAGCDDYLAKPVGRQQLLEMLQRWLGVAAQAGTGKDG
jgi:CheY-like chemotaxis protein